MCSVVCLETSDDSIGDEVDGEPLVQITAATVDAQVVSDVGCGDEDGAMFLVLPSWKIHDGAVRSLNIQGHGHEVCSGNLGNLDYFLVIVRQVRSPFLRILYCFFFAISLHNNMI